MGRLLWFPALEVRQTDSQFCCLNFLVRVSSTCSESFHRESRSHEPLHLLLDQWKLAGGCEDLRIWTRKHLKIHDSHFQCSFPFVLEFALFCSLWWSFDRLSATKWALSGLCGIHLFLSAFLFPIIFPWSRHNLCLIPHAFTKHFDLKSQSQIYRPLKSLMKDSVCVQSVEQFNWRLTDISSDSSASHLRVFSADLLSFQISWEIAWN